MLYLSQGRKLVNSVKLKHNDKKKKSTIHHVRSFGMEINIIKLFITYRGL